MAAAGAAAAVAIANAIKASGVLVRVDPQNFQSILRKIESPWVITAKGGLFSTKFRYMVSHKGFAFFTKSTDPLILPSNVELIAANKIWLPQ